MSDERKVEALKVLYEGHMSALRTLSERSFSSTLQTITFNVVVVAGLVGSKVSLSTAGQVIATFLVLVFNALVVGYLLSKSFTHHREKARLVEIERELIRECGLTLQSERAEPSFKKSFIGGSGLFITSVTLACALSVAALWMQALAITAP